MNAQGVRYGLSDPLGVKYMTRGLLQPDVPSVGRGQSIEVGDDAADGTAYEMAALRQWRIGGHSLITWEGTGKSLKSLSFLPQCEAEMHPGKHGPPHAKSFEEHTGLRKGEYSGVAGQ
jgi:hypothetical protein